MRTACPRPTLENPHVFATRLMCLRRTCQRQTEEEWQPLTLTASARRDRHAIISCGMPSAGETTMPSSIGQGQLLLRVGSLGSRQPLRHPLLIAPPGGARLAVLRSGKSMQVRDELVHRERLRAVVDAAESSVGVHEQQFLRVQERGHISG